MPAAVIVSLSAHRRRHVLRLYGNALVSAAGLPAGDFGPDLLPLPAGIIREALVAALGEARDEDTRAALRYGLERLPDFDPRCSGGYVPL